MSVKTRDGQREALDGLEQLVESSHRDKVAFPIDFVRDRSVEGGRSPLSQMIEGGRGQVRLSLYLCLTLKAARSPFDITKKSPMAWRWARILGLPDPDAAGARRVHRALEWLHVHRLIEVTPRPGYGPRIQMLSPTGDGSPYQRPIEQGRYISLPVAFWSNGWILDLSAIGTAVLMALMELDGGRDPRQEGPRHIDAQHAHGVFVLGNAVEDTANPGFLDIQADGRSQRRQQKR